MKTHPGGEPLVAYGHFLVPRSACANVDAAFA
jgi:hypothetical protein